MTTRELDEAWVEAAIADRRCAERAAEASGAGLPPVRPNGVAAASPVDPSDRLVEVRMRGYGGRGDVSVTVNWTGA